MILRRCDIFTATDRKDDLSKSIFSLFYIIYSIRRAVTPTPFVGQKTDGVKTVCFLLYIQIVAFASVSPPTVRSFYFFCFCPTGVSEIRNIPLPRGIFALSFFSAVRAFEKSDLPVFEKKSKKIPERRDRPFFAPREISEPNRDADRYGCRSAVFFSDQEQRNALFTLFSYYRGYYQRAPDNRKHHAESDQYTVNILKRKKGFKRKKISKIDESQEKHDRAYDAERHQHYSRCQHAYTSSDECFNNFSANDKNIIP